MASQKVVVGGSSGVTASQLKDFFRQIEDGSITGSHLQAFLDHRDPWIKPPTGGFLHRISVHVDPPVDWYSEVKAAAPETPRLWSVYTVGAQYPDHAPRSYECELILVKFGVAMGGQEVRYWAQEHGLRSPASARELFALSASNPDLGRKLGPEYFNHLTVVTLCESEDEGEWNSLEINWNSEGERRASRRTVDAMRENVWYVFVNK